jgi:glutathione S-transferase
MPFVIPINDGKRHIPIGISLTAGWLISLECVASAALPQAYQGLEWLDSVFATRRYVAGDVYTIADITALVAVDFTRFPAIEVKPELQHLKRWHAEVSGRPSAQA